MKKFKFAKFCSMFLSLCLLLSVCTAFSTQASVNTKYIGNVIGSSIPSDFSNYWNQITPENASKWGSVESTRGTMNWSNVDLIYNYAKSKGDVFKFHTLVWGSQEPGWISGLSASDQKAEVAKWIKAAGARYPDADLVDVVNEPLHTQPDFKNAIGGNGDSGWDWVVWSFEQARAAFPNSKLLINEYGIISDPNAASNYIKIINILKQKGLIDGIGIQCHYFNMDSVSVDTMKTVLNMLSETGLPIYVSELDMSGNDSAQLSSYQQKFPVLWENPSVKGITLWGYIQGQTWADNTYLVYSNGGQRPALKWLTSYLSTHGSGTNKDSTLGMSSVQVDKNNPVDITIPIQYNGNTLTDIFCGSNQLVQGTDYTVSDTSVTLLKSYLTSLANSSSTATLTFHFSAGSDASLSVNVTSDTPVTGNLKVEMYNGITSASTNGIMPRIRISNTGSSAVDLSTVKLRYYYTEDGTQAQNFWCDWSPVGTANVTGTFGKISAEASGADSYLEIGFTSSAGSLAPGAGIEVQARFSKNDWSNYTQTGDYSFNPSGNSYSEWNKITAFVGNSLVWGTEP